MLQGSAIYSGTVVHARLRPKYHKLSYRVFSALIDVDRITELTRTCHLFSHNRFNLFSFYDRDHGPGDGVAIGDHARGVFRSAGLASACHRVLLLSYPRVLGSVFNPLSVYFGYDPEDRLAGLIYEVNNTVGERKSYVVSAGVDVDGVYAQTADKEMYVSPFTPALGHYGFRVTTAAGRLVVGVQLFDAQGALLRTHFSGRAEPFTNRTLSGLALRFPLQTAKVVAAIHFEALRLFLKGVPLVQRHRSPRFSVTVVPPLRVNSQG